MPTENELENASATNQSGLPFPQDFFPELLRHSQNPDGGWGYHPGSQSCAEPTAWAILALDVHQAANDSVHSAGSQWLRNAQLAEGAWPAADGKRPGCWVTALACLALLRTSSPSDNAVAKGLKWICGTWPAEGNTWWRLRQRLHRKIENVAQQDHSLRGWGWTPDTASWVEPTALSLLLLQEVAEGFYPPEAKKRVELGEKMLYNRACPGGGWNAGNPLVYGVPGLPRFGPTVWALLALRNYQDRTTNVESIEWLERNYQDIKGPGSLALAHLCLKVYGRETTPLESRLHSFYLNSHFLQSVPVSAWASLALGAVPDWLGGKSRAKGEA